MTARCTLSFQKVYLHNGQTKWSQTTLLIKPKFSSSFFSPEQTLETNYKVVKVDFWEISARLFLTQKNLSFDDENLLPCV